jgi:hypothetical protein
VESAPSRTLPRKRGRERALRSSSWHRRRVRTAGRAPEKKGAMHCGAQCERIAREEIANSLLLRRRSPAKGSMGFWDWKATTLAENRREAVNSTQPHPRVQPAQFAGRIPPALSSPLDQLVSATFATCSAPRAQRVPARAGSFVGPLLPRLPNITAETSTAHSAISSTSRGISACPTAV